MPRRSRGMTRVLVRGTRDIIRITNRHIANRISNPPETTKPIDRSSLTEGQLADTKISGIVVILTLVVILGLISLCINTSP